jgi:hypothetical protein
MRLPESLFAIINALMRALLRSPLHGVVSRSIMLISYRGRKSGRELSTPLRYLRVGAGFRCFSDRTTKWWRNLQGGAEVTLRIAGADVRCHAIAIIDDPARIRAALSDYLREFPQDAAYHHVRLDRERRPVPEDLELAVANAVLVEAQPRG